MIIFKNNLLKFLQLLIFSLPISFLFGNLLININIILISVFGLTYYYKDIFNWSDKKILYFSVAFFSFLILTTYYQLILNDGNKDMFKSLLFLRYLFLFVVIKTMVIKNELNIKYFLILCLILSSFIAIDIIIQFIFNQNILGYPPVDVGSSAIEIKYYTSIFGKELIAGGYLQMFSIPGIFGIFFLFKKKKNKKFLFVLFFLLALLFLISLTLAGNRMPVLMFIIFLISLSLIIKIKNKNIIFFSTSITIALLLIGSIYKVESIKKKAINFYAGIPNPIIIVEELNKKYPKLKKYENSGKQFHSLKEFKTTSNYKKIPFFTGHLPIYLTSIDLYFDNPFIGKGIKSFRNHCYKKIHLPNRVCQNHAHNFILEILNDTGFIGLFLIYFLVIYLLFKNYKDYTLGEFRKNQISNWIYLSIILTIFIQFFPLRSAGSFFSTFNSAYTFLFLGISVGLNELRFKKINN